MAARTGVPDIAREGRVRRRRNLADHRRFYQRAQRLLLWLTILLLVLVTPSARAQPIAAGAFFVAVGGRDSWSGHLPTANQSGTDGPFATLAAARTAMRAVPGAKTTYVRAGNYYFAASLDLDEADSGEKILAYPGEHPVLYGGLPLSGLHASGSGLAAALPTTMPPGLGLPLLIQNDRRLPVSRVPPSLDGEDHESAWLFADSSPSGIDVHHSFRVRASDAAVLAASGPGTFVTIFGARGWQDYVLPVREVDRATRVVTLDGTTWDAMGEGSRFAFLNVPTADGWWLDPKTGTLRLSDGRSPGAPIIAATLPCIIRLAGSRNVVLSGLRLVGSASEGAGLCLSHPDGAVVDRIDVAETGDGIRLDHATNTRISDSEIAQIGAFGITLRHGSDGTLITENWLHDIGWLHQDASAIWFDASSHNLFARNHIENVAKFGIGGGSLTDGSAHDDVIEGNEIDQANQRTSDGGAILVIGWAQDKTHDVIRGNFVSETGALGNTGWDGKPHTSFQDPVTRLVSEAIYLDDWASGVEVTGNLLCSNIGGIELHAGWDNHVASNVFINNTGIAIGIDAENWLGRGAHPHVMDGNVIEGNAVVLKQPSTGQSGIVAVNGGDNTAQFDRNVYSGEGLNAYSFHQKPEDVWAGYSFGIEAWRRHGQDRTSSVGQKSIRVTLENDSLRVLGAPGSSVDLSLGEIGPPADRSALPGRVRKVCGLR